MWKRCPHPSCADMLGRRLWYLAALAGCVVFYICYQEWFAWFALLCLLWLPWLSLLLSLPGMLTFHVRTEGRAWVQRGELAEIALFGGSRWPVPPFRGQLRLERRLTGETWVHRYSVKLPTGHCGAITATPEKLWVFDYLGLFRFKVRRIEGMETLVRPEPVPLETVPNLEQLLTRRWRPKPGGGFAENHEMRLYRPGDNLNQVHWKLTAKTGDLIIREPMEPQRERMVLTLDLKGSPEQLDRMLGRLLWLGGFLLEKELSYVLWALTGEGIYSRTITREADLTQALDDLLRRTPAGQGSMLEQRIDASWHYHIGGEPDEA